MFEEKWTAYAKAWSENEADRARTLEEITADGVSYCDPNAEVSGREAFAKHIGEFQRMMPDCYFEMGAVTAHHERSLAQWTLKSKANEKIMSGTSFATHSEDGKFESFNGFFG